MIPGIPHHITQRGNRRENVFFVEADRQRYLDLLKEYSEKQGLEILAYCLMTNHIHLVAIPRMDTTLADVLKPVHTRYAQHVNWTHRLEGRLWQGRFFSCPLDDSHCLAAVRYVECNPVRAAIVSRAELYPWSSAADHVAGKSGPLVSGRFQAETGIDDWAVWLQEGITEYMVEQLRRSTRRGRPLGDDSFIARLELLCNRILRPRKVGRPRRSIG